VPAHCFRTTRKEHVGLYQSGISSLKIGIEFNVNNQTIINVLRRHGIPIRGYSPYSLEHPDYFDNIDTEPQAYWLGFLAADGCIPSDGNRLQVALQRSDRRHLERFRGDIGADNPIYDTLVRGKYPTSKIAISSQALTDGLRRHGLCRNKSLNLQWADDIQWYLWPHYMRGFTDGDGGFYTSLNKYTGGLNYMFCVWCASDQFLNKFQEVLVRACSLPNLDPYVRRDKPDRSRMLAYCGRCQVRRIFDYLYKDATVWLPRKRDNVEKLLRGVDEQQLGLPWKFL